MEKSGRGLFFNRLILTFLKNFNLLRKEVILSEASNHFSSHWLKVSFLQLFQEGGIDDESEKERRSSRNL